MIKILKSKKISFESIWPLLIAFGLLIQSIFYLAPVLVPDEQNFWGRAQDFFKDAHSLQYLLLQKNTIGYGSLFWVLLTWSNFISENYGFLFFRSFILVFWFFILFQASFRQNKEQKKFHLFDEELLFLLFSAPFWWYGKLASPEILSCQLGFLGLCLQSKKRPLWGACLIGLAIGLKPTNIIFGLFYLFYILDIKTFTYALLAGLAGLIISNPILLKDPQGTLIQFFLAKNAFLLSWSHFYKVLFGEYWEWDIIFSGSLFSWILNPVTMAILIFLSWKNSKRLALAYLVSFAGNLFLVLTNSRFLGWYWMPFFFISLFVVRQLKPINSRQWKTGLLISILLTSPVYIFQSIHIRGWQIYNHFRFDKQRRCIEEHTLQPRTKSSTIIDLYEFTEPLFDPPTQLQHPPKKYISNWAATDWLTNVGVQNGPYGSEQTFPPLMVIINPRSIKYRDYENFEKYYTQRRPQDKITLLGRCGSTKIYWIE